MALVSNGSEIDLALEAHVPLTFLPFRGCSRDTEIELHCRDAMQLRDGEASDVIEHTSSRGPHPVDGGALDLSRSAPHPRCSAECRRCDPIPAARADAPHEHLAWTAVGAETPSGVHQAASASRPTPAATARSTACALDVALLDRL